MPPISHHDGTCLTGGSSSNLRVHVSSRTGHQNFSFPPLPESSSPVYKTVALEKATLALAPGCISELALTPNADNGPGTLRNIWIGRVDEVPGGAPTVLNECGCGIVFFLGGSGGLTGDNLRYIRHMAAQGYTTIAPDSMAAPDDAYPRHRDLYPSLSAQVASRNESYWCANDEYAGGCKGAEEGGAYPGCFSSNSDDIIYDSSGWAAFYERIFTLRSREMDALVEGYASTFGAGAPPTRLFLFGNSEGAMAASRYYHPLLVDWARDQRFVGRLLTAWSCEYIYMVSCEAHAQIGLPTVPVLNLLSVEDEFFGTADSVAARVGAAKPGGYGANPPTGSCAAQMRRQGVTGASFKLNQPYHDNVEQGGSFFRMASSRFLADPKGAFRYGVLSLGGQQVPETLCKEEASADGVLSATCDDLLPYVTPQPAGYYDATKCNWKSEEARPTFVRFDAVPAECIARYPGSSGGGGGGGGGAPSPDGQTISHLAIGAAIGVLITLCAVVAAGRLCGRSFVQLFDERGGVDGPGPSPPSSPPPSASQRKAGMDMANGRHGRYVPPPLC